MGECVECVECVCVCVCVCVKRKGATAEMERDETKTGGGSSMLSQCQRIADGIKGDECVVKGDCRGGW